jgi:hypothetical protein
MSKKPLVPNKNPKGLGKGKGIVGKAGKAANAGKVPRRTRICSRLSKGRLTILIAEVDSIAKGFKGLKGLKGLKSGGGSTEDDYYERLEGLFSEENMKNIKRLKEDLVNDILGTMAEGLENLVDFKNNTGNIDEIKKGQLLKFISIINDIDNLGQEHISKIIKNDSLKGLDYIYKITTLVMINILKNVNNLKYPDRQIQEPSFKYLNNTKLLIEKITTEYNGKNEKVALQALTEDVKRELEYYNYIYILNDYDATKDDENDAKQIIECMKEKCKEIEDNEFKRFIDNPLLRRDDFTTGCEKNQRLIEAINKYNDIIKLMKDTYNSQDDLNTTLPFVKIYANFINDENPITKTYINELFSSSSGLLSSANLYKLYGYIIHYEDKMKSFPSLKKKYIECVKVFYGHSILTSYGYKPVVSIEDMEKLRNASIGENLIKDYEEIVNRYNSTLKEIESLGNISNEADFYNNIPIDIEPIIKLHNILCNASANFYIYKGEINIKLKAFMDKNEAEAKEADVKEEATADARYKKALADAEALAEARQKDIKSGDLIGGKLTTKYISTGNFVYILYEKKKIKRCVYAKAKGRGKYCKIKGDYILVSKLKVV